MPLRGLADKVAIVVGGATGLGAATAIRLGTEGSCVVVGDLAEEAAQGTAEHIVAAGGKAMAVGFDLAEPESVRELIRAGETTFGGVDAVFNVGADMSTLRAMKHAIPRLLNRGGGAIVNMSSAAAFQGEPSRPAYATAKAGIGALTRHVASRWGKDGIRCNAVAPGFTATEAIRSVPQWPELEASALRRIRAMRVGLPEDVASLVAFLLSDEGAWINGQVINIDGGTILR
jgi:NAD(P)-dependent dehydrogenase (short-subunit alcohol dehydrogenase family)